MLQTRYNLIREFLELKKTIPRHKKDSVLGHVVSMYDLDALIDADERGELAVFVEWCKYMNTATAPHQAISFEDYKSGKRSKYTEINHLPHGIPFN